MRGRRGVPTGFPNIRLLRRSCVRCRLRCSDGWGTRPRAAGLGSKLPNDSYRLMLQKDMTYAVEISAPNSLQNVVRGFRTLKDAVAWLSHQKNMTTIASRAGATHEGG